MRKINRASATPGPPVTQNPLRMKVNSPRCVGELTSKVNSRSEIRKKILLVVQNNRRTQSFFPTGHCRVAHTLGYIGVCDCRTGGDRMAWPCCGGTPRAASARTPPALRVAVQALAYSCRANVAHIRQSRPEYGTYKTVKARMWHI